MGKIFFSEDCLSLFKGIWMIYQPKREAMETAFYYLLLLLQFRQFIPCVVPSTTGYHNVFGQCIVWSLIHVEFSH